MISWIVSNLWLIPAVPLASALLILALANSWRRTGAALAIIGQIAALALAVMAFLPTLEAPGWRSFHNFTWFTFGEHALRIGWVLDPLAAAMLLMITFVGLWIFVFSVGYMAGDKNFTRFFAYLSFFSAAMLGVVIANSLLLLFVCWELVGLASYLLIGFWIHKPSAAAAAKKLSSPRASATSGCSSGFSGSTAAAAPCSFTMTEMAVSKRPGFSRSEPAPRLSRC